MYSESVEHNAHYRVGDGPRMFAMFYTPKELKEKLAREHKDEDVTLWVDGCAVYEKPAGRKSFKRIDKEDIMRISYLAPNQAVLHLDGGREVFVSYETPIAQYQDGKFSVRDGASIDWPGRTVGKPPLKYSSTTSKYLCRFMDMDKPAIYAGIKSGDIAVVEEIEI